MIDAGSHDGEARSIAKASQEIGKGTAGKSEKEHLTAGVEIEKLVQAVTLVLSTKLEAVAPLLRAYGVAEGVGLFDSGIISERAGSQVEFVGHRNFRHSGKQSAQRRCDS